MTLATIPERITSAYLRTLPKLLVVGWAADVAERVLDKFEVKYPDDQRPRLAIAAARAWTAGVMELSKVRQAADAAADADAYAAAYAAYAAADAAADAAYAADAAAYAAYAADAAAYAADAADAAAYAADAAAYAAERAWQRNRLIELMAVE